MSKISSLFYSGQKLTANDLNALINAINDNNNRIAAIEALGVSFDTSTNTLTIKGKSFVLGEGGASSPGETPSTPPSEETDQSGYTLYKTFNYTYGTANTDVDCTELATALTSDGDLYVKCSDGRTTNFTVQGRSSSSSMGQKTAIMQPDGYFKIENLKVFINNSSISIIRFVAGETDIQVYKKS